MKTPTHPEFNKNYDLLLKHLKLKGLSERTIDAYSRGIRRIGEHFDHNITQLTTEQLLDYFHALLERLSWSAVNADYYGFSFFHKHVLERPLPKLALVKPPRVARIPDILSLAETQPLFMATDRLSYRVFFFTLYSLGLRISEAVILEVGDIDAHRLRVHIRNSKGNKDRIVPLPLATLSVLRQFWAIHRHPTFIFPNRKFGLDNIQTATTPMDKSGIQSAMKAVVKNMRLKKRSLATLFDIVMPRIYSKRAWTSSNFNISSVIPVF